MALSTSPTLQQIRAEIARNSNRTTSSTEVQGLKGCFGAAIPGGFNRTYLALASNTDIDGTGRNQKDFRAYEQDSPYFDYGIGWTNSSTGVYDLATYFNCDFNVDVAVNPSYNSSYVTLTAYIWPFFNPNCSYRSHSVTGRNEAVRTLRVTFDTSNISVNTSVSIVMESNYTYQSSQLNESLPVVTYTVSSGPSGFGPDPGQFFCLLYEMKVYTSDNRYKNVNEVKVGDMLKTDTGMSKVIKVITEHKREGYYVIEDGLKITNDHPFKDGNQWIVAEDYKGKKEYIDQEVNTVYIETESGEFTTFSKDKAKQWTVSGNYASELV